MQAPLALSKMVTTPSHNSRYPWPPDSYRVSRGGSESSSTDSRQASLRVKSGCQARPQTEWIKQGVTLPGSSLTKVLLEFSIRGFHTGYLHKSFRATTRVDHAFRSHFQILPINESCTAQHTSHGTRSQVLDERSIATVLTTQNWKRYVRSFSLVPLWDT